MSDLPVTAFRCSIRCATAARCREKSSKARMAGESFLGLEPGTFGNQPTPPRLLEQIDYLYSSTGTMLQHSHKDGVVLEDGAALDLSGTLQPDIARAAAGSAGGDAQVAEHLLASRSAAALQARGTTGG